MMKKIGNARAGAANSKIYEAFQSKGDYFVDFIIFRAHLNILLNLANSKLMGPAQKFKLTKS